MHYVALAYDDGQIFWEMDGMITAFLQGRARVEVWKEEKKEREMLKGMCDDVGWVFDDLYAPNYCMCQHEKEIAVSSYTRTSQ